MGILDTLEDVGDTIGDAAGDLLESVGDVAGAAYDAAEDAVGSVIDFTEDVADAVADAADTVAGAVADAVGEGLEFLSDTAQDIVQAFTNALSDAADWIKSAAIAAAQWISDAASDTWQWVKNAAEDLWDDLMSVADWIAVTAEKALEWIEGAWEDFKEFLVSAIWILTHLDDFLYAVIAGGLCLLLGLDETEYPLIRHICDGVPAVVQKLEIQRVSSSQNYVVFSDHHMFYGGSGLDTFHSLQDDQLYMAALARYANQDFTLIENGDVEDLWLREPTLGEALAVESIEIIGGPIGGVMEDIHEDAVRKQQLGKIIASNIHVYAWIKALFHDRGRLVRTVGNHDQPLQETNLTNGLRTVYPRIVINDYVLVVPMNPAGEQTGYPLAVIAHGHQFDAWNTRVCARMAGEVITETVSGASSWAASTTTRSAWESKMNGKGFNNKLADLTFDTFVFEAQSVDEIELRKLMREAFRDAPRQPHLILGHTHEPRFDPTDQRGRKFHLYTNSGTSGRYDDLLWCVEIVAGQPTLHAWQWDAAGNPCNRLMVAGSEGRLVAREA